MRYTHSTIKNAKLAITNQAATPDPACRLRAAAITVIRK